MSNEADAAVEGGFVPPPLPLALRAKRHPAGDFLGAGPTPLARALAKAAETAALEPESLVVLSGLADDEDPISGLGGYRVYGLADKWLPFALGITTANPALKVLALVPSIGGMSEGWSLWAARRNADLTVLVAPPEGDGAPVAVDAAMLGVGFAARVLADEADTAVLARALRHRGFSLVEAVYPSPDMPTPPLGVYREQPPRPTAAEVALSSLGGKAPVRLPVGMAPEEIDALWRDRT